MVCLLKQICSILGQFLFSKKMDLEIKNLLQGLKLSDEEAQESLLNYMKKKIIEVEEKAKEETAAKIIEVEEKATAKGRILENGLPPLGPYSGNSSFQSKPNFGNHEPRGRDFEFFVKPFQILEECKKKNLNRVPSHLWMKVKELTSSTLSPWQTEACIQQFVQQALGEVSHCCNLQEKIHFIPEKIFSFNGKGLDSLRADIAVIRNEFGSIVGVCEVKKPSTGSTRVVPSNDLKNETLIVQISNYMLELRYAYGLKFVFGIISTYNHWRIVWLKDSNEVANASTKDNVKAAQIIDDSADTKQIIYVSKVISYDDPELVPYFASVLWKMYLSPIDPPTGFNVHSRKFLCLSTAYGKQLICHKLIQISIFPTKCQILRHSNTF
jgi:hypothetical protein